MINKGGIRSRESSIQRTIREVDEASKHLQCLIYRERRVQRLSHSK